ncbi:MBL fold metallo-hydrolase [Pectobacterium aquaticum]|uniref:MBL fold metallo-hydrolase n=1 Tax=Pectobacterium aquaticum TaxID=2204145 RepID=A0AA93AK33_9GAMM|nr:MBL fold metallo-hydrolase [Pectobacterium aquaticum]PLY39215.1 MBL fold metallo-hydrolase [Pectobacterium carotovorum]MCH5051219.1 MBL fold metallo-hydrolase [Pectobacterium aquaticum]RRN97460.1 MBL fold metallo-hydrolase [Pectobacterium aquaticum]RRO03297.1 MBL fold metallo-hydrolase [Pectobacterium aquaticum]RRO08013.1 MBL fold metallo-hydrolase [Pectobacterium aquaticum]
MLLLLVLAVIVVAVYGWLKQPQYVSPEVKPQPENPLFRDGAFHNPVARPTVASQSRWALLYRFLFEKDDGALPDTHLPSEKTDLHQLSKTDNVIIWMGHSSYFIQLEGKTFLLDPVFSDNASPVPRTNVAFKGSNVYSPDDVPTIDYLLITHDHWDHLDYPTLNALRGKIRRIVTPTGVGSYFVKWGFPQKDITEGGWFSCLKENGVDIHVLPTQHFSGRLLKHNQTLWGSFALITEQHRLYLGGDSGYGAHYKAIAERLGGFDIAILECGQYDRDWPHVHMTPEESAQAASDLQAKAVLPSHNSKFKLAHHRWNDPLERISQASENQDWRLMTPRIGERVQVDNPQQAFSQWWNFSSMK